MPNHFQFLISSDIRIIQIKKKSNQERNVLWEGFRNLLSSYTPALINKTRQQVLYFNKILKVNAK